MFPENGDAWDYLWEPFGCWRGIDESALEAPLCFRPASVCCDCGSTNLRGLRIRVGKMVDLFCPDLNPVERDEVFAVMAVCHWHDFLIPTQNEAEVEKYMLDYREDVEERTTTLWEVRDNISDRWNRRIARLKDSLPARIAFNEAASSSLELRIEWPPNNIKILVPSNNGEFCEGYRVWSPSQG